MEYMRAQNRPFNAIMLQQNLHGAVGKTQCVKVLADLAKKKKLTEGVFGKQKIYWINQEGLKEASAEEIKELDEKIKELKEQIASEEADISQITLEVRQLDAALTDEQLDVEIKKYEDNNKKMLDKLEKLRKSDFKIDPKQREKTIKQWESLRVITQKFFLIF